jgi:hypothetical protein
MIEGWLRTMPWRSARRLTAAELDAGDRMTATLDCTGGFYSTQRWRGTRLSSLTPRGRGS